MAFGDPIKFKMPLSARLLIFLQQEEYSLYNTIAALEEALLERKKEYAEVKKKMFEVEKQFKKDMALIHGEKDAVVIAKTKEIVEGYKRQYSWFDKVAYILKGSLEPVKTKEVVDIIMEREGIDNIRRRSIMKKVSDILNRDERIERHGNKAKSYTYSLKEKTLSQ